MVSEEGGYVVELPCFAYPSKGGNRNVKHQYVLDMAAQMPYDVCTALKMIQDNARKSGNSALFLAAKATYKAVCRGN